MNEDRFVIYVQLSPTSQEYVAALDKTEISMTKDLAEAMDFADAAIASLYVRLCRQIKGNQVAYLLGCVSTRFEYVALS